MIGASIAGLVASRARSLCQPDVFDVLSRCELLSPIAVYRIPTATRRHYGRMARFPNGILPIGDAICSFDPAFGQGMTVAAQEDEALMDCLQCHGRADEAFRRDYFRRADAAIEVPWRSPAARISRTRKLRAAGR